MLDESLLRQRFPLPPSVKLRKPRFGTSGPSDPQPVPPVGELGDTGPDGVRAPYKLSWPRAGQDSGLGIEVTILEQKNGELLAYVESPRKEALGQGVSVALLGNIENRLVRKTVNLSKAEEHGCSGVVSFGMLSQVVKELGDQLQVDAFLLVEA